MYKGMMSRQEYVAAEAGWRAAWDALAYPSYEGDRQYVFVSFAPPDTQMAIGVIELLNQRGYNVCYDKDPFGEELWSGELSNAVARSEVVLTLTGDLIAMTERRDFVGKMRSKLRITQVEADVSAGVWGDRDGTREPATRYPWEWCPADDNYDDELQKVLEHYGIEPHTTAKNEMYGETPSHDLGLVYFHLSDKSPKYDSGYVCNLRTHEVNRIDQGWGGGFREHSSFLSRDWLKGRYLGPIGNQELFQAYAGPTCDECMLLWTSREPDYQATRSERTWLREARLDYLDQQIRDLKAYERERERKQSRPYQTLSFPSGYPYMDEFEYLGSQDD